VVKAVTPGGQVRAASYQHESGGAVITTWNSEEVEAADRLALARLDDDGAPPGDKPATRSLGADRPSAGRPSPARPRRHDLGPRELGDSAGPDNVMPGANGPPHGDQEQDR
jgi:hypothetical protein